MNTEQVSPESEISLEFAQSESDIQYITAMQIFNSLHRDGLVTDSELVEIDAILAKKLSASSIATTPKLCCIK